MSAAWSGAGGCARAATGASKTDSASAILIIGGSYRRSTPTANKRSRAGSAPREPGDRRVDHLLVGARVELVADQRLGGSGGGGRGLGANLLERGALGGGDLVLGHAGAALDQS